MRHTRLLLFLLFAYCSLNAQSPTSPQLLKKSPFVLGETVQIQSEELHEERTLNIYLPSTYGQDSTKRYPVIYLLDGSADEDFIHIAGLVQFGTFPWVNTLPESIVVGIANVDRKRDFTFPTQNMEDKKKVPTSGGSANFIHFIEAELQPLINKQYRTDTIKTLIGQSLGGLVATEIIFKKPDLFTHYIIVSPSLWWDDESLLKLEPKSLAASKKVYLTVGQDEDLIMVQDATKLSEKLQKKPSSQLHLIFKVSEGQDHGNILHLAVYDAFGQMFKATKKE